MCMRAREPEMRLPSRRPFQPGRSRVVEEVNFLDRRQPDARLQR